MLNTLYHTCIDSRLREDEPSGSKNVEDNKKFKNQNNLEKVHFVGL